MQSVEMISSGLDQVEGRKPIPLSKFRTLPTNVSGLNQRTADLASRVDSLKRLNAEVTSALERARSEANDTVDAVGWSATESGLKVDTLGRSERSRLLKREVAERERAARAHKSEDRAKLAAEVGEYRETLGALRSFFSSPVRILNNATFGRENRSRYFSQLSSAGPAELEMHAHRAVATRDADLMAAVLQRYDGLTKRERQMLPLSRDQLALSIVAEDFRKAQSFLKVMEIQLLEADVASAEAAGRSASMLKLSLGNKRADLVAINDGDTEFLESLLSSTADEDDDTGEPDEADA